MVRERSARRAQLIGLVAALLLTAAVGVEAWVQSRAARDAMLWVRHTDEVLHTVKDLDAALASAEAEQRGFLLTGDDQQLGAYQEAVARVVPLQSRLRLLTPDNPAQQDRLRALSPLVQQRLAELAGAIAARRDRGLEAAMRLLSVESGRQLAAAIDSTLSSFTEEEQRLLGDRLSNADRFSRRAFWLAASGFAAGIVLLGLSFALLGRASRRRLASEAAYRDLATQSQTVLDSISHGVAVIDAAGRLVRWNECLPIVLGLPDYLMHAGTPYSALADHLASTLMRGALFLERWEEIPHSLPERRPVVYARTCPDGRSFEVRRDSMRDGGFVLTVSDITERAGAEARLRAAQRMQAVGQLSGGIAHDFNNLLAVILGNLELALARLEAEHPVRSRLDRAIWAAKRGASLTHQLLAFARRQPLVPKPTDLASLLQEMADLLRRTLGEQIALEVVTGTDVWPAMADAAQVESAVLNLALNARDAMPQGGCLSIEVANAVVDRPSAAQPDIAPGEYVTIAVSDTGTGMSPDIMARAFEPFFTTKGSGKGTGLGLAMVFGFAKQSGGHAQIDSTPGQGTTVRIFLPRATPGTAAPEDSDTGGKAVPGGSARVLIVEDEAEVRDILAAILEDLGYSVLTAPDGAAALKVVAAQSVDLALIDVVLPGGMAGREVARRIAEKDPKVRTLFMSGYSEGEGQDNTPGAMIASIAKPFDRERLARLVAQALGTATRP